MACIREITSARRPVGPDTLGHSVYETFRDEPDTMLVPVIAADGRPVGLIERHAFSLRMASEYGRALYAARPVSLVMDADPLVVDADHDVARFTDQALSTRPSDLLRGFVVVEAGRYLGVGTALALLSATSEQNRSAAQSLAAAKAAVEREKCFTETVIENIPAMVFVKDVQTGRFVLINRAGEEMMGYRRAEIVGCDLCELYPAEEADRYAEQDRQAAAGEVQELEEEVVRRDGRTRRFHTRKLALPDESGASRYVLGVTQDVTERLAAEARVARMAHYDSLTDLPNRLLFGLRLEEALASARRGRSETAVLCVDLDHFKLVNDTLGHPVGDALLRAFAGRLQACVRAGDTVARLGGDEFAVIEADARPGAPERLAARIAAVAAEPFQLMGQQVLVGASVGVARFPADADDAEGLLKKADMALYAAKARGRGGFALFEPEMDARLQARRALELDLRRALAAGEFEVHYQPLYDLHAERLSGCEALCRWRHPQRGWVAPVEFIPLAEETGLIDILGEWVLRTAATEAAGWPAHMKVAVNVSPIQFRTGALIEAVTGALGGSGLAPARLELEITEGVLLQDSAENTRTLHDLRRLGCRVSLDDFGTGFSSLSYLRAFPFDKIKIDRSFVKDLPQDAGAAAIVRAVAGLAAALGVTTVAEGVETGAQLAQLKREGCGEVQGYLIGRPMPAAELRRRLRPAAPLALAS